MVMMKIIIIIDMMKNTDSNTVRTSANSLFPNWDTTLGLL
jgi:hypothetical protein